MTATIETPPSLKGEVIMIEAFLKTIGITNWSALYYNLSYNDLFLHETDPNNVGFERGIVTSSGAVAVDTGRFTGRSAKDKYIVDDVATHDTVWWEGTGSDNKRLSQTTWNHLKALSLTQLNDKKLYVIDGFCGANPETRMSIRLVTEIAWMAHFFKNMFIRPTQAELDKFQPDWTILNACKATCTDYAEHGMRSDVFAAFNLTERMTCIGGTWYGGEIKKGIFSVMNYLMPLKGIASLHCSANMGRKGDTALFFGLSGTGKTTLSADPKRNLIGDDEHGWDKQGVFNYEGGCYAKVIDLTEEKEPDIFRAIKRDALLENVTVTEKGNVDYTSKIKTENSRASYPIYHITNIVKPISRGTHPKTIIFLTCDAYGVLPPVARLTREQAMYQYISGYTAKVAGTEIGITEPKATFSACFGAAFLLLHPMQYAEQLGQKMEQHGAQAWLVNTGWTAGKYGVGHRMSLKDTRKIIDAILDGTLQTADYTRMPVFNIDIPTAVPGVESAILNPVNTWSDKAAYTTALNELGQKFVTNFERFCDLPAAKAIVSAGPTI